MDRKFKGELAQYVLGMRDIKVASRYVRMEDGCLDSSTTLEMQYLRIFQQA